MRYWVTTALSLSLPAVQAAAQSPREVERAPLAASVAEGAFGSAAFAQDDTSEFSSLTTGMYLQLSGLYLTPDDTSITSRDAGLNALLGDSDMTYSNGWGFAVAVGFDFGAAAESNGRDVWIALDPRVEIESAFRFPSNNTPLIGGEDDPINDDPLLITFAINGYLDFDIKGPVDPYIGAGIGLTYFEFGDQSHDHHGEHTHYYYEDDVADDVVASYQIMAGVSVALDRNWSAYAGVRYFETDSADIDGFLFDFTSTDIEFGLRIMMR